MSQQYKVYLIKPKGSVKEIRRFTVNQDVTSSHDYLKNKVASVFPSIGNMFTLHYKDVEGDFISFSSDEELMQALTQVTDGLFRLYVRIKKDDGKDESEEFGKRWKKFGAFGAFGSHYPHEPPRHQPHNIHVPPPPHHQWFQVYAPPQSWGFGPWGHPGQPNQTQQQFQTPGENAQSSSSASADGRHQEQSQSQGPAKMAHYTYKSPDLAWVSRFDIGGNVHGKIVRGKVTEIAKDRVEIIAPTSGPGNFIGQIIEKDAETTYNYSGGVLMIGGVSQDIQRHAINIVTGYTPKINVSLRLSDSSPKFVGKYR